MGFSPFFELFRPFHTFKIGLAQSSSQVVLSLLRANLSAASYYNVPLLTYGSLIIFAVLKRKLLVINKLHSLSRKIKF